jgi:diguanylate cyclase (GGDEF)-like protein/PAS domain S-box-containing protein
LEVRNVGTAEGTGAQPAPRPLLAPFATSLPSARGDAELWSRDELDALLAPLTDTLVLIGVGIRIQYVSAGVRRLLGFDPRSLVGRQVLELLHPDDATDTLGRPVEVDAALAERDAVGRRVRLRHADGTWRDLLAVSGPAVAHESGPLMSVLLRPADDDGRSTIDALRHRLAFEDLLTTVTSAFIHRPAHEVGECIDEALALIAGFTSVDRGYVYVLQESRLIAELAHEWVAPGVESRGRSWAQVAVASKPQWFEALRADEPVYIPSVADLGPDWSGEREMLESVGATATVAVPIFANRRLIGFIGFDLVGREQLWSDDHLGLLSSTAGIISQALSRRDAEQRFGMAFDRAPLGMALHSPDGRHIQVNPAFCELLDRTEEDLLGSPVLDLVTDDDRDELIRQHLRILDGETDQITMDLRFSHADGRTLWCRVHSAAVRESDRSLRYTVSHVEDITALRQSEEDLAHQALHDPLTGLANRALLNDFLERALVRRASADTGVAVLFIDLDRFKLVNDSLGHRAGDALLVGMGHRLEALLRPSDLVARLGGDEFVVVLDSFDDRRDPVRVAGRIRTELTVPIEIEGTEVVTTGSIGIAVASSGDDADDLLRDADAAMYLAKTNGRNRFEIFDAELRTQATEKLRMESALRRALEHGGLEVHYQPEIDLRSGDLVGAEALVRWDHPTDGRLDAWVFIELAEETGLIVELGAWVLREACRQAGVWRRDHPDRDLTIRVNLSGKQFAQADLVDQVVAALREGDVPASALCLEITETALMADPVMGLRVLNDLRSLGVELAIDDFGTGYSSLSYLKRFPVDVLKIDRSFVDGLGADPDDTAIVTAIISLARSLGLRVVAEGVETTCQLAELRRLACDHAQGFLFARPGEPEALWVMPDPYPVTEQAPSSPGPA